MSTLKDRLRARERPTATYPCRVATVEETQAAERALALARKAVMAVNADDKAAARKAKKVLEEAQERRDDCYVQIRLRALEPEDFEDLGDAYPQADEKASERARRQADEAYLHAVFLASVEGDDSMTEEDWTDFVRKNLGTGERNDLYNMAVAVNGRVRALDPSVPKG